MIGLLLLITSCEEKTDDIENIDPTENLILVGSNSDNGLAVNMYTDDSLQVGLNRLYFQLTDESTGDAVTEAHITHKPIMNMATMNHSCPIANPDMEANTDGLFESELVFVMASGMMGTWDDTVSIHNEAANTMHKVVFENLPVLETNMKKNLVAYDADSVQVIYIVTLNRLGNPEVGSNEFTLTVHKKASMMSFPEVVDMAISVNPQMPDMGHGSDGNVNPVYSENGKYEGTVVFSMTGYWTIDFAFSQNDESLGTVQYEVNF